jgi:hypothetical protein
MKCDTNVLGNCTGFGPQDFVLRKFDRGFIIMSWRDLAGHREVVTWREKEVLFVLHMMDRTIEHTTQVHASFKYVDTCNVSVRAS